MTIDAAREYCLSLTHATESIQWGNDLVMKVGGKMFAVIVLEPAKVWISFKCSPEDFAELTERPGIIPAPYAARYHWVALETKDALRSTAQAATSGIAQASPRTAAQKGARSSAIIKQTG